MTGIDSAIAVSVHDQPGIIPFQPSRPSSDAIGVMVKQNGVTRSDANSFNAIPIQIDCQRVTAGWIFGITVFSADGISKILLQRIVREKHPPNIFQQIR
ncbi:hypothetical protein [Aquabacterium soli]|uniref:hypothetical protein n=1 Tax=Aquabacterium soli TaxID=2493092 RepID=UPI001F4528C9|nr:hypothetical protein [Aquabacterium soli]